MSFEFVRVRWSVCGACVQGDRLISLCNSASDPGGRFGHRPETPHTERDLVLIHEFPLPSAFEAQYTHGDGSSQGKQQASWYKTPVVARRRRSYADGSD